jgi:tetratricopeptide (TPR) repeat protein
MFGRAVSALRAAGEFDNPRLVRMRLNWGANLRRLGRYAEARQVLDAALALVREKLGAQHLRIAEGEVEMARIDLAEGAAGAAERAEERIARAEAVAATKPVNPAFSRNLEAAKSELAAARHSG